MDISMICFASKARVGRCDIVGIEIHSFSWRAALHPFALQIP